MDKMKFASIEMFPGICRRVTGGANDIRLLSLYRIKHSHPDFSDFSRRRKNILTGFIF
jgi:hypothetical protein